MTDYEHPRVTRLRRAKARRWVAWIARNTRGMLGPTVADYAGLLRWFRGLQSTELARLAEHVGGRPPSAETRRWILAGLADFAIAEINAPRRLR